MLIIVLLHLLVSRPSTHGRVQMGRTALCRSDLSVWYGWSLHADTNIDLKIGKLLVCVGTLVVLPWRDTHCLLIPLKLQPG